MRAATLFRVPTSENDEDALYGNCVNKVININGTGSNLLNDKQPSCHIMFGVSLAGIAKAVCIVSHVDSWLLLDSGAGPYYRWITLLLNQDPYSIWYAEDIYQEGNIQYYAKLY